MWPLPKIHHEQICLLITDTHAICAWMQPTSKKQLALKAYKTIPWHTSTPLLTKELSLFIQEHRLHNALLAVSLGAPLIHEQLLRLSTASPQSQEIMNTNLRKMLWDYRYLHTFDDGQSLFYVCGITRAMLFAQQLLAQQTKAHLMNVTSNYMALMQAYRTLFGPAFRKSQLALDLITHNYALEKSISTDSIARLVHIDPHLNLDITEHKLSLITMIGLFNQER